MGQIILHIDLMAFISLNKTVEDRSGSNAMVEIRFNLRLYSPRQMQ
jgi:hypothetical protein